MLEKNEKTRTRPCGPLLYAQWIVKKWVLTKKTCKNIYLLLCVITRLQAIPSSFTKVYHRQALIVFQLLKLGLHEEKTNQLKGNLRYFGKRWRFCDWKMDRRVEMENFHASKTEDLAGWLGVDLNLAKGRHSGRWRWAAWVKRWYWLAGLDKNFAKIEPKRATCCCWIWIFVKQGRDRSNCDRLGYWQTKMASLGRLKLQ